MLFTILHNSGNEEEFELLLFIALRRRRKKKRNMWVRPIFSLRRKQGEYNLLQEMRLADREAHFLHNYYTKFHGSPLLFKHFLQHHIFIAFPRDLQQGWERAYCLNQLLLVHCYIATFYCTAIPKRQCNKL